MIQEIFRIDIDLLALASRLKIMKKGFKNFFGLGVSAFHSHTPHIKILKVVVGNTVFILLKCFCFVFCCMLPRYYDAFLVVPFIYMHPYIEIAFFIYLLI